MFENPENKEIRQRIADLREQLQLTQKDVCDRTGLSKNMVFTIESGERQIKANEIPLFAAAFGCSTSYLLTGKEETSKSALDETGLFQTSLNQLQLLKDRYDFEKVRETIDFLLKFPSFLTMLHSYFFEEMKYISFFDNETQQLKVVDVVTDHPEQPETGNFPRLKYLPSEYARLQLLDWLSIMRRKAQEQHKTAPSSPSSVPDEQKPV